VIDARTKLAHSPDTDARRRPRGLRVDVFRRGLDAERSFRRRLRSSETLGDVLVGELAEGFLLAARVVTEDHEF
jgi:hypothetical protein